MFVDVGWSRSTQSKPTQTQGEQATIQKGPDLKTERRSFLPWGNSANQCSTVTSLLRVYIELIPNVGALCHDTYVRWFFFVFQLYSSRLHTPVTCCDINADPILCYLSVIWRLVFTEASQIASGKIVKWLLQEICRFLFNVECNDKKRAALKTYFLPIIHT